MVLTRYEPILDMQVAIACEQNNLPTVLRFIPEWMTELASSGTPQAAGVLGKLFQEAVAAKSIAPLVMSEKRCSSCRKYSLNTNTTIHRWCTQCSKFRKPVLK
jgi:hypothetical protein